MLWPTFRKDLALLLTDLHGLAVLLVMPLLFMLVMSYALSGSDQPAWGHQPLTIHQTSGQPGTAAQLFAAYVNDDGQGQPATGEPIAEVSLALSGDFDQRLNRRSGPAAVHLQLPAGVSTQAAGLLQNRLEQALARTRLHLYLLAQGQLSPALSEPEQRQRVLARTSSQGVIDTVRGTLRQPPEALAQSIPAWLVFGMFFIVMPLTNSLLLERNNGTLLRLRTFPVSSSRLLLAKGLSYGLINLLQGATLLALGLWLVPAWLGRPLAAASSLLVVLPLLLAIAAAAVGLGLLVAVLIRSPDQAVVASGGTMLILAALSGIMVPLEIMPQGLIQQLAQWSPMYWAATGLRDWLLTPQTVTSLIPVIARLLAWALASGGLAAWLFSYRMRTLSWNS